MSSANLGDLCSVRRRGATGRLSRPHAKPFPRSFRVRFRKLKFGQVLTFCGSNPHFFIRLRGVLGVFRCLFTRFDSCFGTSFTMFFAHTFMVLLLVIVFGFRMTESVCTLCYGSSPGCPNSDIDHCPITVGTAANAKALAGSVVGGWDIGGRQSFAD